MKNKIRYVLTMFYMLLLKQYWLYPIENNIVLFMSYDGKQYSDSPRCISEAVHRQFPEKKILWAFYELHSECPDYIKQVNRLSKDFYKTICTAGTIITNNSISSYIPIRKGQIFLNTWHGGSPTKTVGFREAVPNPYYKYHFRIQDNKTTAMLTSSRFFTEEVIKESFGFKKVHVLETGLPKNDVFYRCHDEVVQKVYEYFGIEPTIKIILYAPTFRGDANNSKFLKPNEIINADKCMEWFEKKNGEKYVFLFRAHHAMKNINIPGSILATDYPDMQDLLCAADILITDYSSCMHDFSLMKKPVFLYIPDYEEYMKDRGFYYDIPTMPFPYSQTLEDFEKSIQNFDIAQYKLDVQNYHERMGNFDDGKATERVLEWLKNNW